MRVYVYKSQFRRYSSGKLFQCGRGSWRNEQASNFLYRTCACMKCFIQKKLQLNGWRCHLHYTTMFILLNYYAWHLCSPFACPTIQVHGIGIIKNQSFAETYKYVTTKICHSKTQFAQTLTWLMLNKNVTTHVTSDSQTVKSVKT